MRVGRGSRRGRGEKSSRRRRGRGVGRRSMRGME